MKTRKIRIAALILSVLVLVCAVGCSASRAEDSAYDSPSYDNDYGYAEDSAESKPSMGNGSTMPPVDETQSEQVLAEKIIRTVDISAQTKDFDQVTLALESLVRELGGYVESSRSNGAGYSSSHFSRNASYVFRIPAEQLDAFLSRSGELCRVTSCYSNVSNVTATYYDMQSRLETLRAEKTSLQGMLEQAKDINTMLTIQQYLYDVISEIEAYETQLRVLDSKVSYSTVSLYLSEVVEYTQEKEQAGWGERLGEAFVESWANFADNFQSFTVWFVNAIPTLLVLGLIGTAIVLIVRKLKKTRHPRAKKSNAENNNGGKEE